VISRIHLLTQGRALFSQITLITFIVEPSKCIVNRQIRVGDSKNVIVFDPLLAGHVIRRMRSCSVRIFNGNQGCSRDPPCTASVQGQKVKSQGHKVK